MNFLRVEKDVAMDIVHETCTKLRIPCNIVVSFNSRFTSRMGDANWHEGLIRLSAPLWPYASFQERKETVVHETCHIACHYLFNRLTDSSKWAKAHGPEWRWCMEQVGYPNAKRCHTVKIPAKLRRKRKPKQEVQIRQEVVQI